MKETEKACGCHTHTAKETDCACHEGAHKETKACCCEHEHGEKETCCCEHEHTHEHGHPDGCGCDNKHTHDDCCCEHDHHGSHDGCGCGCEHDHDHGEGEGFPWLLIAAGVLFVLCLILEHTLALPKAAVLCMYLVPYIMAGHETLRGAVKGILRGRVFGEEFLMTVASVGAFCVGSNEEAAAVMLLYGLGEYFEGLAVGKSRASVRALMALRPDIAHIKHEDGTSTDVSPEEVAVGQTVEVRIGERIPLDGVVISGTANLDTSALTGESLPRVASVGDTVASGCIATDGVLLIRTTLEAGASTAARILELAESAASRKTKIEAFLSRFSRVYTPCVVVAAVLVALVPSLIFGDALTWIHRALTFLVVSCPCALVISVPLTFFSGIGAASSQGILIKGSQALDALSRVAIVASDKTGTLTEGRLRVARLEAAEDEETLLSLAAHAECHSRHPAALAIVAKYREVFSKEIDASRVSGVTEHAGKGICAVVGTDGSPITVAVGNVALMQHIGVAFTPSDWQGAVSYVAADGRYLGAICVSDTVKAEAKHAISELRRLGVREIHMLTGDTEAAAEPVARELQLDGCHAALLPDGKLDVAEALSQKRGEKETVLCIGDGINDAPLLASADVGVAMGALGSDAAMEASDVVIMNDNVEKIPLAIALARRTMMIARQNIAFALIVKFAFMILGALGITGMWAAVFGDVGVCLLCILNAARARKIKKQ